MSDAELDAELQLEEGGDAVITAPVWAFEGFEFKKHELAVNCVLLLFGSIRDWNLFTQLRRVSRVWLNAANVSLSVALQVARLGDADGIRR
jgi:hypothetical protein